MKENKSESMLGELFRAAEKADLGTLNFGMTTRVAESAFKKGDRLRYKVPAEMVGKVTGGAEVVATSDPYIEGDLELIQVQQPGVDTAVTADVNDLEGIEPTAGAIASERKVVKEAEQAASAQDASKAAAEADKSKAGAAGGPDAAYDKAQAAGEAKDEDDKHFEPTEELADELAKSENIDFNVINKQEFLQGLKVEQEHIDVTDGDPVVTAHIALAHLKEIPDYYSRLAKMEAEAKEQKAAPGEGAAAQAGVAPEKAPVPAAAAESVREAAEAPKKKMSDEEYRAEYEAINKEYSSSKISFEELKHKIEQLNARANVQESVAIAKMPSEESLKGLIADAEECLKHMDSPMLLDHLENAIAKVLGTDVPNPELEDVGEAAEPTKLKVVASDIADETEAKKIAAGHPTSLVQQDPQTKKYSVVMKESNASLEYCDKCRTQKATERWRNPKNGHAVDVCAKCGKEMSKEGYVKDEFVKEAAESNTKTGEFTFPVYEFGIELFGNNWERKHEPKEVFDELSSEKGVKIARGWLESEIKKLKAKGVKIDSFEFSETDSGNYTHAGAYYSVTVSGPAEELAKIVGEDKIVISVEEAKKVKESNKAKGA